MDIVDAHMHEPAPWERGLDRFGPDARVALATEILLATMDAVGVHAALLTTARRRFTDHACGTHPERFRCVAEPEPEHADVEAHVAGLRERIGCIGVRLVLALPRWHPAKREQATPKRVERLRAGAFERYLEACEAASLPVFLTAPRYLDDVRVLAQRHPGLQVIVDHLGLSQPIMPVGDPDATARVSEMDDPPFADLGRVLELASLPNVAIKVSGVPSMSGQRFPFLDVWPPVVSVIRAFTPARVMWGSDIQRCRGALALRGGDGVRMSGVPGMHTYADAVGYLQAMPDLEAHTAAAVFGATLRRLVGWCAA